MRGIAALSISLLAALGSASPIPAPIDAPFLHGLPGKCYKGRSFPAVKDWPEPTELWDMYKASMRGFNTDEEMNQIFHAILNYSNLPKQHPDANLPDKDPSDIDPRLIFAVMMRESSGDAHIHGGDGGVSRGLMQINSGENCKDKPRGHCPADKIWTMVHQGVHGVEGKSEGLNKAYQGIKQNAAIYNANTEEDIIALTLRRYNSGPTIPNPLDLAVTWATPSYVSDVGNIMLGTTDPGNCKWPGGIELPEELREPPQEV